ncbi:TonB-dependent receptor [Vibrio vulnificus]|uniref:TonB-dependent receptor plug domain-containing protein n=1 Tax=Vibrio vulnificus TaxID=672 RepID=UPI00163BB537|nr:TonB-dependent receptor [Vibrio vulnificus]QND99836.1 TonB-dependent receptor [Vibrio vulnificus]
MYKNTTALSVAISLALGTAAMSPIAFAEEQQVEQLQKMKVTGSRISRVDAEAPQPVVVFGREDIINSGATSIAEFLQESPTLLGPGATSQNETLTQVAGSASADYRGFGQDAVLVLLNGRRLPNNPIASTFVDLNQLPTAAVERVEILNDGASAIYGSDAISGVINIITKTAYDGVTVTANQGISSEQDGEKTSFSIVGGKTFENESNLLVSVDYFKQGTINATDRSYSSSALYGDEDGRSPYGYPASVFKSDWSEAMAPANCSPENTTPSSNAASGTECLYDFSSDYQLVPESERWGIFSIYTLPLSDSLTASFQARYNHNKTLTANAPAPGFLTVEVTQEMLDAGYLDGFSTPPAVGDSVYVARRWIEFGKREKENTNETIEVIASLEGYAESIEVEWQAEFGHAIARAKQVGTNGQLFESQMTAGVASGEINPFDPSQNSAEMIAKYQQSPVREGEEKITFSSLRVNGSFNDEISWASGVESRFIEYYDKVSENYLDIIGGAGSSSEGTRFNSAAYFETIYIPTDSLEFGAAVRYDYYNDFGSAATGKISAGYRPIDTMLLRASVGSGFKAPDMKNLYLAQSEGVLKAVDTKRCSEVTNNPQSTPEQIAQACKKYEVDSISGGNPELDPETSVALNLGLAWEIVDDLSITADYWNIKVDDKITSIGVQEIINNEAKYGDLITRDPVSGRIDSVTDVLQNVAQEQGQGLDISVRYTLDTNYGEFKADVNAAHLISFKRSKGISDIMCEEAGTYGEPKWKGSAGVLWSFENFNAFTRVNYIGEYKDNGTGRSADSCGYKDPSSVSTVKSLTTVDLRTGYNFQQGTTVNFGIKNVFDTAPSSTTEESWPWYNQSLSNPFGRYFYLEASHSF